MTMVKDAIKVAIASRSPKVLFIFAINMLANKTGSTFRIRNFSEVRVKLYDAVFCVSTWDALLAIRPGNEPKVNAALRKVAESEAPGLFVDVGAHIGRYCYEFAKHFEKTIAFEPTSATFKHLHATWTINPSKDKIQLRQVALSDTSGQADILISKDESQNSFVRDVEENYLGTEVVSLRTLDEELSVEEKSALSLLLIDVEGAEHKVLEGARETLEVGSPTIVIELLGDGARDRCNKILGEMGYHGTRLDCANWKYVRSMKNLYD